MARYFKLIEITRDEYIKAVGEDLKFPFCSSVSPETDGCYIATTEYEDEIIIDMEALNYGNA